MKTLLLTLTIIGSSLLNQSFGKDPMNLNKKLHEAVIFENKELHLEKNKLEFVKISFKINKTGKIEILEMNYSDELIKSSLVKKLTEIKIKEEFDINKIYNYNFTFKKI